MCVFGISLSFIVSGSFFPQDAVTLIIIISEVVIGFYIVIVPILEFLLIHNKDYYDDLMYNLQQIKIFCSEYKFVDFVAFLFVCCGEIFKRMRVR